MPRSLLLAFVLTLAVTATAGAGPRAVAAPRCVAIVSTNDMHGAVEPHVLRVGDQAVRHGGMLVLASYVEALRRQHGERMLLLDAGDIYQGSIVSNLSWGRAAIAAMNAMGYDAAVIGNHEFDFGAGAAPGETDRLAVVKARVAEARFPFLAANIVEREDGAVIAWKNTRPSLLLTRGGIRVGIVGVTTPDTPRLTRPQNVSTLEFQDPLPHVVDAARELRARGAELVVLLGHMGGDCTRVDDPHDLGSCELDGELFAFLRRLPRGTVDVAVGGHTHQMVAHWVEGVATTEASARARALGYVEACVARGGGIDREKSRIHPPLSLCLDAWADGTCGADPVGELGPAAFAGRPVAPSTKLARVLAPFRDEVAAEAARPIGATLPRVMSGRPLGELVLEAMRQAAGATIAVQNRGGIRAELPAGELTYSQVFEALPFDNRVAVAELTAAELTAFVTYLTGKRASGPLVAGLRVERREDAVVLTLPDGSALEPERRYRVATNDYLALGGEGLQRVFGALAPEHLEIMEIEVRGAVVEHLRRVYPTR